MSSWSFLCRLLGKDTSVQSPARWTGRDIVLRTTPKTRGGFRFVPLQSIAEIDRRALGSTDAKFATSYRVSSLGTGRLSEPPAGSSMVRAGPPARSSLVHVVNSWRSCFQLAKLDVPVVSASESDIGIAISTGRFTLFENGLATFIVDKQ